MVLLLTIPVTYRPITNLCTFRKVLEDSCETISMHHPIVYHCYRAIEHFTPQRLQWQVVSDLQTNVDSGSPSLLLSLDISAAFDTLNHEWLLQRAQDLLHGSAHLVVKIILEVEVLCSPELVSQTLLHTVLVFHRDPSYSLFSPLLLARLYLVLASCTTSMLRTFCYTHLWTWVMVIALLS